MPSVRPNSIDSEVEGDHNSAQLTSHHFKPDGTTHIISSSPLSHPHLIIISHYASDGTIVPKLVTFLSSPNSVLELLSIERNKMKDSILLFAPVLAKHRFLAEFNLEENETAPAAQLQLLQTVSTAAHPKALKQIRIGMFYFDS